VVKKTQKERKKTRDSRLDQKPQNRASGANGDREGRVFETRNGHPTRKRIQGEEGEE